MGQGGAPGHSAGHPSPSWAAMAQETESCPSEHLDLGLGPSELSAAGILHAVLAPQEASGDSYLIAKSEKGGLCPRSG